MQWDAALRWLSGATIQTSPCFTACSARRRIPPALIPSSFVIKILLLLCSRTLCGRRFRVLTLCVLTSFERPPELLPEGPQRFRLLPVPDRFPVFVLFRKKPVQEALLRGDPPALVKDQLKGHAAVGDMVVKPGTPHCPGNAAVSVNAGHHLRRQVFLRRQVCRAFPEPLFQRDLRHDPEDVHLVRVPEDLREDPCLRIQVLRKGQLVVQPDRRLAELRPALRKALRRESSDQSLPEQKVRAELRMIHGLCVEKCPVTPYLLKAADVVQKAQEPGQIQRDPSAETRHPERVHDLKTDHGIFRVIPGGISAKRFYCCFSVEHIPSTFHPDTGALSVLPAFVLSAIIAQTK